MREWSASGSKCRVILMVFIGLFGICSCWQVPDEQESISEGNACRTDQGARGTCRKLVDCPALLRQVIRGARMGTTSDHCGWSNDDEIVCCAVTKSTSRPPTTTTTTTTTTRRPLVKSSSERPKTTTSWPRSLIRSSVRACELIEDRDGLNPLIYNGTEARDGEFPFIVALAAETDDGSIQYTCGGSLITSQHVLTAAHCIYNTDQLVPIKARVGGLDLNERGSPDVQEVAVGDIMVHPKYRASQSYHDIAILKLKRKFNVTGTKVKPVCLQRTPIQVDVINQMSERNLSQLVAAGWGDMSFGGEQSMVLLKTGAMRIVKKAECQKHYSNIQKLRDGITDDILCARDQDAVRRSDSCQGDSGGPLAYGSPNPNTLLGITSNGKICGSLAPGLYTNIYSYLDWIEETVWPDGQVFI